MHFSSRILPLALAAISSALPQTNDAASSSTTPPVSTTNCNGRTYTYEELAGYGFILNNTRDKFGDTIGGIGSAIAVQGWQRKGNRYSGILYGLPDRGWNTEGTLNYQNRIHKFLVTFTPNEAATVANPGRPNLQFRYLDTTLLVDPNGGRTSGLDGAITGPYLSFPATGEVPSTNYTGDGYGGAGPGGRPVVIDSEGIVLGPRGTYWVSDEYGDYIYRFSSNGRMINAIRPPPAFIPIRNGQESFSADSPPRYNPALVPTPGDPTTGRANNQGLEGLSSNPSGTKLYALTQSALIQDGGSKNRNSRHARFLIYDISGRQPRLEGEYVVRLNRVDHTENPASNVARQSEIHYISDTQFLVMARDSGHGRGQGPTNTNSTYRQIDVFDISGATNIAGTSDYQGASVAPGGVLLPNITAATYCQWLDFNNNAQLNRFGVHNGGAEDAGLLNEKWESISIVPANTDRRGGFGGGRGKGDNGDDEYYILSMSDNDFITQDGHLKGGQFNYSDESGYNLDSQVLIFKVKLPAGSRPLVA